LLQREPSNAAFERAFRPATFIPVDSSPDAIQHALRQAGEHTGIVRDCANPRALGLATMEDVLESLAGNLRESKLARARSSVS